VRESRAEKSTHLIGLSVEQVIQLIRFVEFKLDQPARTIGVLIDI